MAVKDESLWQDENSLGWGGSGAANPNLAGSFHAGAQHFSSFRHAHLARLFLFCFCDPAAVFLAMGVAEFPEHCHQALLLEQLRELGRHLNGAFGIVAFENNGYSVAGTFADLLADGLEQGEHVLRATVFHHGAGIGNAVEGNFHGYLAAGTELLFDIVGKEHAGSSATGCFNGGFEFVLLHGCAGPALAAKGHGEVEPISHNPVSCAIPELKSSQGPSTRKSAPHPAVDIRGKDGVIRPKAADDATPRLHQL